VQPDVFAYALAPGKRMKAWADVMPLILAVEITSSDAAAHRAGRDLRAPSEGRKPDLQEKATEDSLKEGP